MVSEARESLSPLFRDPHLWLACYPGTNYRPSAPPSDAKFSVVFVSAIESHFHECLRGVLGSLGEAFEEMLSPKGFVYNETFWTTSYMQLNMDLMYGLSATSLNPWPGGMKESEVRALLIDPFLRSCLTSSSVLPWLPAPADDVPYKKYNAAFYTEPAVVQRKSVPGQKPHVDYCMVGYIGEELIYNIPIEAKKQIELKHSAQLAQYLTHVSVKLSRVGVGLLIDEGCLQLAFSGMSCSVDGAVVQLPFILLSPKVPWRMEKDIKKGVWVGLAMLPLFNMQRIEVDGDVVKSGLGEEVWEVLMGYAQKVVAEANAPPPMSWDKQQTHYQEYQALKEEMGVLQARLRSQQSYIDSMLQKSPSPSSSPLPLKRKKSTL